jgi:hypothetical protein
MFQKLNALCNANHENFFAGRFYGKLQSRSFPELSESVKEKQPVRQMSDNQPTVTAKGGQMSKQQVASTKCECNYLI